jgi:hypothetical protein
VMSTRRVTTSPGPPDRAPLVATNPPWHARRVPRIVLDFDPEQPEAPSFQTETSELVFFLSWAFSQRYGANHEMSQAALILRSEYKIDMTPLLTFADREVEDPDDADVLERSWQDAAPLAECCRQVTEVLRGNDSRLTDLREEYPNLPGNVEELGQIAAWAAERDARIRITYELEAD